MELEFIPENKRDCWEIHVEFMFGDADIFKEEVIQCESREETEERLEILCNVPSRWPHDKYKEWCQEHEYWLCVPMEPPSYSFYADVYSFKTFYWDNDGAKFKVEIK